MAAGVGTGGCGPIAGRPMVFAAGATGRSYGAAGAAEYTGPGELDHRLLSGHAAGFDLDHPASAGREGWAAVRPDGLAGVAGAIFPERLQFPRGDYDRSPAEPDVVPGGQRGSAECFGITPAHQRCIQFRGVDQSLGRTGGAVRQDPPGAVRRICAVQEHVALHGHDDAAGGELRARPVTGTAGCRRTAVGDSHLL